MYTEGFLKLSRNILQWRWYKDANTLRVFLHLLLCANYTDCEFEIHKIKRGQLVTGRKKLSEALKMSEREVRTALNHLKSTNDITIRTTSKYSIITIVNYEELQVSTNSLTINQPTSNQQSTSKRPQYNKDKKYKKYNNAINDDDCETSELVKMLESKSVFTD